MNSISIFNYDKKKQNMIFKKIYNCFIIAFYVKANTFSARIVLSIRGSIFYIRK